MTLIDAIRDDKLFARWFKDPAAWATWTVFLKALFALTLTAEELAVFTKWTGRTAAPTSAFLEAWLIVGRRGGKSLMLALVAVFLACFRSYAQHLAPGERATILILAADRKQARTILRFIRGMLKGIPMLKSMIEKEKAESFDLTNRVTIEVATASYRTTRGYTIVAALCDEIAFWRSEDSASPDEEILTAVRPAMATIPGAMLLCASSPYARRGAMWQAFDRYYGKDEPRVLIWKAPTRAMNPTVPQHVIDEAFERDPASASAEYGAEFRTDVEEFLARHIVEDCVDDGVHERAADLNHTYIAFTDPSGGVGDSMTLAIAHSEGSGTSETAVLDLIREIKAPFSPEAAVSQFANECKRYRVSKIIGDRFGAEWVRQAFRNVGINYEPSEKPRSDLYLNALPMFMSGGVRLLDNPRMVSQFIGLERRTGLGKKDVIDHRPGSHDDISNAVAGAIVNARGTGPMPKRQTGPQRKAVMSDPLADFRIRRHATTY